MTKFHKGQNQKNQGDPFNSTFNSTFNPERKNWRKRDNNPPPPPLGHMPPPYPHGMNNAGMSPGVGMGMGMGNYYYPGGGGGMSPMPHMSPMPYPSPMQPSPVPSAARPATANMHGNIHGSMHGGQNATGAATSVATVPGYPNRYYPRQLQPPRAASASPKPPDDIPSVAHWAADVANHHLVDETSVNEATLTARVDQSADEEKRLFLEEYRYAGPQAYEPPNCPKFTESDLEKERGTSSGDSGNNLDKEKATGTSSKSKLRGDAPVFVPQKKRQPTWMVVSSF